jgi:transposase
VPRTRPPDPEEFRREAIRLARLGDKPQRPLAKDLGISDVTLRNWIKQEKAERGERPGGLSQDEREELQRLRDENAKLRMEREILAKAAAFFAKESDAGCRLRGPGRLLRWLGRRSRAGGGQPGRRLARDRETGGARSSGAGGSSARFWGRTRSIRAAASLGDSSFAIWSPFPAGLPARTSTAGPRRRGSRGISGACACRPIST